MNGEIGRAYNRGRNIFGILQYMGNKYSEVNILSTVNF